MLTNNDKIGPRCVVPMKMNRRNLLTGLGSLSAGLILSGCSSANQPPLSGKTEEAKGGEVTAVEDLMREHGILRRALFVYSEAASKFRKGPSSSMIEGLQKTAMLFRTFGEEYHEKKLEEAYIFPAVKRASSPAAIYPDILVAQHQQGREITDYILAATRGAKLDTGSIGPLAGAMESIVRMYRAHAAREDTVVFPAWKETLTTEQLDEMGEKFEDIEHEQFGEDGFEKAVRQIAAIESALGLADLAQFTAPPPPV
jgi:hemerythrin-like domain-containing protein